jgi:hypothetical protein
MALTLNLPPHLAERLAQAAEQEGVPEEQVTLRLLDQHLPPTDRRAAAIALLDSWLDEGEAEDQRETGEYLIRTLEEDRLSDRQLFPPETKGQSW